MRYWGYEPETHLRSLTVGPFDFYWGRSDKLAFFSIERSPGLFSIDFFGKTFMISLAD